MRRFYGTDNIAFTFVSDEFDGQTRDNNGNIRPYQPRSFSTLSQAEEENGQSRIYLGIHWAFDKTEGIALGRLQSSLWARLPLPIAALITTGGRSVHAWVMLNCSTEQEHRAMVHRIYQRLTCFGLCLGNKNPSRLSRLPGAQREIAKCGDGRQRLLYLNPEPSEAPIFERGD